MTVLACRKRRSLREISADLAKLGYLVAVGTCRMCGKEFVRSHHNALRCSVCRPQWRRTRHLRPDGHSVTCRICGTEFVCKTTAKLCSLKCRQQNEREWSNRRTAASPKEVACRICGAQFPRTNSAVRCPICQVPNEPNRRMKTKYQAAVETYRNLCGPCLYEDGPTVSSALKELPALLRAHFDQPVNEGGHP